MELGLGLAVAKYLLDGQVFAKATQIIRAHAEALASAADTYVDPRSGYTVLTAAYLARRGHCCDSGCRHCPYLP